MRLTSCLSPSRPHALGTRGRGSALPPAAWPPGPQHSRVTGLQPARPPWPSQRLGRKCAPLEMLGYHQPRDSHVHGRPSRGLTMSERCLAVNHGQPGLLLTLFAVRSRRHSYHSQADSAVRFHKRTRCHHHVTLCALDAVQSLGTLSNGRVCAGRRLLALLFACGCDC
jgi:hypothetical protein